MGIWAALVVFAALVLLLIWFAQADAKQPAKVAASHPGSVAYRVYNNFSWSNWGQVQKKFGVRPMSDLGASLIPKHNVVLSIGPEGLQLGFGARSPFLVFSATEVVNIALVASDALFGIPIFELRKHGGGTDLLKVRFLHSAFRGMHRDEGMAAVIAMRKAAGLPDLSADQLWARDPDIILQGTQS